MIIYCNSRQKRNITFNETNLGSTDFAREWETFKEKKTLLNDFIKLKKYYLKLGVPIVIGEFGVGKRTESERAEYLRYYIKAAKQLESFPLSGTPLDNVINVKTDYRYISSGNYLLFYIPKKEKIKFVRVIHGSRDFPHLLF